MNRVPVIQSDCRTINPINMSDAPQLLQSMLKLLDDLRDAKSALRKNGMLSLDFVEQTTLLYDSMIDKQRSLIRGGEEGVVESTIYIMI